MRKKNLIIALLGMVSLLCVSCEGDTYVTEVTKEVGTHTWSEVFTVTYDNGLKDDNPWIWDEDLFYCKFDVPELTGDIFERGVKQAFMYYSLVNNTPTQSPLPFSDFYIDDDGNKWEEHFTVEWQPGAITFIMKPDDKSTLKPNRSSYDFLVQFLW